jgi:hypothetical protein
LTKARNIVFWLFASWRTRELVAILRGSCSDTTEVADAEDDRLDVPVFFDDLSGSGAGRWRGSKWRIEGEEGPALGHLALNCWRRWALRPFGWSMLSVAEKKTEER